MGKIRSIARVVVAALPLAGLAEAIACEAFSAGEDAAATHDAAAPGERHDAAPDDATEADSGSADSGPCPGGRGAAMIHVTDPRTARGFCIDATEATQADYDAFLRSGPNTSDVAACGWNVSFAPAFGYTPDSTPRHPVVAVDWCDALAYCRWAGKRLCRPLPGTPNPSDAHEREWYSACSQHGTWKYPWGSDPDAGRCNLHTDSGTGGVIDVAAAPACEGGYAGIHDMVGNVREWEDYCPGDAGVRSQDECTFIGSGWEEPVDPTNAADWSASRSCERLNGGPRNGTDKSIGIRCCADAL